MDIEKFLMELESIIVEREMRVCGDELEFSWDSNAYNEKILKLQNTIIDYVKGLEEDAWKYRDAQD